MTGATATATSSVVIPTLTGGPRLRRLLDSLGEDVETLVVDNGSPHGLDEALARRHPNVNVIRLPRNEGFSRAVNRAARAASGDVLILLNDDCVCEPGFVGRLAGGIDASHDVAMAAAVMLEAADPRVIDSAGIELDDTLFVWDYLNGLPVAALAPAQPPPFGPSGAASAFARDAFLDVGGFDEQLFAYWEDVDLVLRLRGVGATCALVPDARVIHYHSATLGSGSARKNYLTGFGRAYVLRKWGVARGRECIPIALREAALCAAQLVVDGTTSGIGGRIDGWRAADDAPRLPVPPGLGTRRSTLVEARRRLERRRRLRRRAGV